MTTPTPPLSPAAQAIRDAYKTGGLDAALIVAADQVVPEEPALQPLPLMHEMIEDPRDSIEHEASILQRQATRRRFLALAAELQPLWKAMAHAYAKATKSTIEDTDVIRLGNAAELHSIADWIEKRQIDTYAVVIPDVAEVIGWLRIEAERAEGQP